MTLFLRRLMGALSLDAGIYENIEADRRSAFQSMLVVVLVCAAAGIAAIGLGAGSPRAVAASMIIALSAWLMWATVIVSLGTTTLAEPQTEADIAELLQVLGYAAAPGLFLVFAVMQSAAWVVITIVAIWMIAAAVVAVRQALDYTRTSRAVTVCLIAFAVAVSMTGVIALALSTTVS